jgi:rfaE bifunctional protein nucleotidyltransferase chain/domain/rfaE bifunctional protein kinase chain/domain
MALMQPPGHDAGGKPPRIAVLGDSVLDVWLSGTCHRLSREGPVPVVDVDRRVAVPGAAANTGANLAAMGAQVDIVTAVGDDPAGESLLGQLRRHSVGVNHVTIIPGWVTPSKYRVVAADHTLVRFDYGGRRRHQQSHVVEVLNELDAAVKTSDALVICDYNSMVAELSVSGVWQRLRPTVPLLVIDAHDIARWQGLHPDVVTPNAAEAFAVISDRGPLPQGPARLDFFTEHRELLRRASGAATVVVTLDRDGAVLLDGDIPAYRTWARSAPEEHCAGAGDTFTAAMTVGLLNGWSAARATDYAQAAADVVTGQPGTAVCGGAEIPQPSGSPLQVWTGHDELAQRVAAHRQAGRRIVFTNGCFDVLHRGHVTYLREAKAAGDVLVVAINSDDGVSRLKGPDRPINAAGDRAAVLSALGCVDFVTIFDEDTPASLIRRLRPDIYVKGGDYNVDMLSEATIVHSYGGQVRMLSYIADHSTTETIQRTRAVNPAPAFDDSTR